MRILLTGATGFMGSHLLRVLVKEGHEITILTRSTSNLQRIQFYISKINIFVVDLNNLNDLFEQQIFDAVIHTATSYGRKGESKQDVYETNLELPRNLLLNCENHKVGIFINADTTANRLISDYTISKKNFLDWAKDFIVGREIKFINVLLESMFGPGDDETKFVKFITNSFFNNVESIDFTLGEQRRDFIYIDDVIAAFLIILKKCLEVPDLFQEYHIGSGKTISIRQLVELIHQLTNAKTKLNWGALAYRNHEMMESKANIEALEKLGWQTKVSLKNGLYNTIYEKDETS